MVMNEPAECECCTYQIDHPCCVGSLCLGSDFLVEIPGCLGEAYYVFLTNPLPNTLGLSECLCMCVRESVCTYVWSYKTRVWQKKCPAEGLLFSTLTLGVTEYRGQGSAQ